MNSGVLKVYIEGDGSPWHRGRVPSDDPGPRDPLALKMMVQDDTAAIYVGRPCYFGLQHSPNCSPALWTSARYSTAVIDSMRRIIERYQAKLDAKAVVLIGYSGGGSIAALLARNDDTPIFLLTIAANLDTDAWTNSKDYLPLSGSLNPVDYVDELKRRRQLHLIGAKDETVPPFITRRYTDQLPDSASREFADFDHSCCWLYVWPQILEEAPWHERTATAGQLSLRQ